MAWIAAAGVLTGLATLTHENAALIAIPLAFGVWTDRPRTSPRSLKAPVVLVVCAVLTIVPWTIRNALVMHRFIPVSDEAGITLIGTYNAASAADRQVPYKWRLYYSVPGDRRLAKKADTLTEPQLGSRLLSQAWAYIRRHPLTPLAVAYHNGRRLLELEGTFAWHASASAEGLSTSVAGVGVVSFWLMCALALGGTLTRAARRAPRWLWVIPLLLALSVVLVNVETPRFREPVEPFLIFLAACAVATAVGAALGRRSAPAGVLGPPVAAEAGAASRLGEVIKVHQRLSGSERDAG
jgi:hypothetical protein